jgi:hypothetical protein
MWSPDMDCSQHSPATIVPQRGQVPENSSEPPRSESWGVLHEDVSRSNLANDPSHLRPQSASLAVEPCTFPCDADILAGKSTGDDVDVSAPPEAVEGSHVIPDREAVEQSVTLAGEQHTATVGIKLNSADGAPAKPDPCQDASSCPCK